MTIFKGSKSWTIWLNAIILWSLWTTISASTGFPSPAFGQRSPAVTTPEESTLATKGNATNAIPEWKQNLPAPLNNKTKTLQRITVPGPGGRVVEVFLLGTAHVSIDSSRDVRLLLETIKPSIIFLELCDQRIPMLVVGKTDNTTKTTEKVSFWKRLRQSPESKSMYSVASSLLTNMQEDYADSLGVELGGEFRVAYDYWDEHRTQSRFHMILGDRPVYLTLTRAWESLGIWGKTKLVLGLLISSLQKPNPEELREWMHRILSDDSGDLLTESIAELAKHFPTLEEVIIRERDAYMACKLYQTCRQLLTMDRVSPRHRLVAIVGAGHVEGICRWLTTGGNGKTPEQVLARLIEIKKKIPEEDSQALVNDVIEVNHELLQEMVKGL